MSSSFKVPFALDGDLVIDVSMAQKKADYKCIDCGSVVRRRGGPVVSDHFYHMSDGNCSGESYWHKLSKKIISEIGYVSYTGIEFNTHGSYGSKKIEAKIRPAKRDIKLAHVEEEKVVWGTNFVADLSFKTDTGHTGYIEIVYKHHTEPGKLKWYKENNIFVIDIHIDTSVKTIDELRESIKDWRTNYLVSYPFSVFDRFADQLNEFYNMKSSQLEENAFKLDKIHRDQLTKKRDALSFEVDQLQYLKNNLLRDIQEIEQRKTHNKPEEPYVYGFDVAEFIRIIKLFEQCINTTELLPKTLSIRGELKKIKDRINEYFAIPIA